MRGYIDHVTPTNVSGWVYDPAAERLQVRVTIDDKVLVEGVADQPRPDVGQALGTGGEHGFRFGSLTLSPKDVERVVVQARPGPEQDWKPVKRRPAGSAGQYQTFDDAKGGSKSTEKLEGAAAAEAEEPPQRGDAAPAACRCSTSAATRASSAARRCGRAPAGSSAST